ncbi:XRE family transcriptional regulator [Megamonas rupellensis]|jgi:transcriptional regulator with XRE-family HTH domain|uniref:XRE family transcriptional regulator n=1 Tax=Megamonas rupellensis TaxID=491921 RepID=A0A412CDL5_9FIRM|nr:helix-turn-helix transcriptional regulator [Megamonas rupellensis]RGQ81783.1 XRE family transcriptional regulator [Megamonas rupellensis]
MPRKLTDKQLIKIGSKILYYRRIRKMTQLELATAVGISESYLSKIERGKNNSISSLGIFLNIVKELNVKIEDIIEDI